MRGVRGFALGGGSLERDCERSADADATCLAMNVRFDRPYPASINS